MLECYFKVLRGIINERKNFPLPQEDLDPGNEGPNQRQCIHKCLYLSIRRIGWTENDETGAEKAIRPWTQCNNNCWLIV
jgi:hypothetical protein